MPAALIKERRASCSRALPYIVPQIQASLDCNLACGYCFQRHEGRSIRPGTAALILEQLVHAHRRAAGREEIQNLQVYWHGGEPLLAGLPFFKRVVEIQSSFEGVSFENRIQTNGTLMNEAFAEFFTEHGFQVGFSLDGPRALHNRHRRFRKSQEGSFDAAMKGVELHRRVAGAERAAVIAVITRASVERAPEIFHFFKALRSRVQLDIFDLRCRDFVNTPENGAPGHDPAPSPRRIGRFLTDLFDLWFYDNSGEVDFSDLRQEVKSILRPEMDRGDPIHKKRCDFRRLIFDPRGRAYSCDQYVNDEKTALGDIHNDSITELFQRKERLWREIKREIRRSNDHMACGACEWGRQCGGGCVTCVKYNARLLRARAKGLPDERWVQERTPAPLREIRGETYYCDGLRAFRKHVKQAVSKELADAGEPT